VLLARAQTLTRDRVEAQDLVQDTIVRCLAYAPDPDRINEPRNFLIKIMYNVWLDRCRLRHRENQMLRLDDWETTELLEIELAVKVDFWRRLESEELLKTLRDEQRRLSDRENLLLDLHFQGWTNQEIANSLGEDIRVIRINVNAVMAKLRYRLRNKKGKRVVTFQEFRL